MSCRREEEGGRSWIHNAEGLRLGAIGERIVARGCARSAGFELLAAMPRQVKKIGPERLLRRKLNRLAMVLSEEMLLGPGLGERALGDDHAVIVADRPEAVVE